MCGFLRAPLNFNPYPVPALFVEKFSFFSSTNVPIAYQVSVRYALRPEYLTEFLAYHLSS